jgi:hypothetical protein
MAYRELGVIEVSEVLRRFCLGEGLRAIARGTGSAPRDEDVGALGDEPPAVARPMPLFPPVTRATFPSSLPMVVVLVHVHVACVRRWNPH